MATIPKITHQIWMQGWDKLPEKFRENVRLLEEFNPDFEHRRWDEEGLRAECEKLGKPYLDKFNSFEELVMRVDFGRYVVLYQYGGISVDTDMKSLKSLSETPGIETDTFIVSRTSAATVLPISSFNTLYNNAIFMVRPKHPVMKDIIDTCTKSTKTRGDYLVKEFYVDGETGPSFLSNIIEKHKESVKIVDPKYFEPCFSFDPYCKIPESTILDHKHENSWMSPDIRAIIKIIFYAYYNLWAIPVLFILIFFIFTKSGKNLFAKIFPTPSRK
jgi:mannosyltransferase OCH1-like enzyme